MMGKSASTSPSKTPKEIPILSQITKGLPLSWYILQHGDRFVHPRSGYRTFCVAQIQRLGCTSLGNWFSRQPKYTRSICFTLWTHLSHSVDEGGTVHSQYQQQMAFPSLPIPKIGSSIQMEASSISTMVMNWTR